MLHEPDSGPTGDRNECTIEPGVASASPPSHFRDDASNVTISRTTSVTGIEQRDIRKFALARTPGSGGAKLRAGSVENLLVERRKLNKSRA